jgi:hypothetical protein
LRALSPGGATTAIINQIRCFLLEHGITVRQRLHWLRHALPNILAQRTDVLSPRMVRILEDLAQDLPRLDERIEAVTDEIAALRKNTELCGLYAAELGAFFSPPKLIGFLEDGRGNWLVRHQSELTDISTNAQVLNELMPKSLNS